MKFEVRSDTCSGVCANWQAQAGDLSPITCSIPAEFMGPGGGYSPEDLFAISLLSCLIATFKVYAEKAGAKFEKLSSKALLTVDKIPGESGFAMTQAEVFFDIQGAENSEQIKKLLEQAIKDCAISNSIKTGKTFHINFS